MTIDECMAKATAAIDDMIANAMAEGIRMVADKDGTPEEIETYRAWYAELLAADRAEQLARLRSWIERRGETLQ